MSNGSETIPAVGKLIERIERLNSIGIALSAEQDSDRLLEIILLGAKELTGADGGTVYEVAGDEVRFRIVRTDSLGLSFGGSTGAPVAFKPIPLRLADGQLNHASVVAHAVLDGSTVNIPDAYHAEGFDFTGTRAFDARTGYHSTALLTVPMRNHEGLVTGVLQLLNPQRNGSVRPFSPADQRLVESLASQAATALSKKELIDGMKALFEGFIQLIATAIDDKSPYTGGHCRRVPELTMLIADACIAQGRGELAGFAMSAADRYELRIAAWLHDCGKVTTPEWVMDKATKLSRLFDRIELLATRFELRKRELEAAAWRAIADGAGREDTLARLAREQAQLDEDLVFLRHANLGSEAMRPEDQERVRRIAAGAWTTTAGDRQPLLSADEVANLCIVRGTLLAEEREVINHHIVATIHMLESLPFPRHLRRVPEFAGGHHERMDGMGYPKGLTRAQMSVQARVMGVADVFEALTAGDRPYKKAMTLSQALRILGRMKLDGHIDPDVFDAFVRSGVWRDYAARFLTPAQRDEVDPSGIPGWPTS
ncbi:MAG: GAF domain-containing protein [Planctomycetes bacterium]|nr:GAF domain-containing protein [Planctomycetota bacterium]